MKKASIWPLDTNSFSVIISFWFTLLLLSACTSPKAITYFQDKNSSVEKKYSAIAAIEQIPDRIQTDDVLAIVVNSLSDETNNLFNSLNAQVIQSSNFPGNISANSSQPLGYPIDKNGEVTLPIVGKIILAGMTLKEAGDFLEEQLSKYIKNPSVKVRMINHKFTVLGEVNRPGTYNLLDDKTTLPTVISSVGDITLFGRRDNVMLIRVENNKREVVRLDLTSRDILNSPYYYIENNDVIYVESRPGRVTISDRGIQLLPIILASITTSILLLNRFIR